MEILNTANDWKTTVIRFGTGMSLYIFVENCDSGTHMEVLSVIHFTEMQ